MTQAVSVLVVDDEVGDLGWLLDIVESRGYGVRLATNEEEARARLLAVSQGLEAYVLAVVDVMMAIKDITSLAETELDESFFDESRDTGIRVCRYARRDLGITTSTLPMVCLTVRDDDQVKAAMAELEIPLFDRSPSTSSDEFRRVVESHLPPRPRPR
jgi:CheY-like chemotaxis protein